jgi:hypothetical protein
MHVQSGTLVTLSAFLLATRRGERLKTLPLMCLSSRSGSSSSIRLSKSSFLNRSSSAVVQCATICIVSSMKVTSGVILLYQLCTKSLRIMARKA